MSALGMMQTGTTDGPQLRYLRPGATLGKGPHVRVECPPGEAFVAELRKVVDQLRDAATEGNWSLDWSKFNSYSKQAETAAEQRNYAEAVRDYARALRAMMTELRNQRLKGRRAEPEDGESAA
jgi:hypothetical protein